MTGRSGLFKGTVGDLNYHATKAEKALLNQLYEKRTEISKQLDPIDADIAAVYAQIKERVYGDE